MNNQWIHKNLISQIKGSHHINYLKILLFFYKLHFELFIQIDKCFQTFFNLFFNLIHFLNQFFNQYQFFNRLFNQVYYSNHYFDQVYLFIHYLWYSYLWPILIKLPINLYFHLLNRIFKYLKNLTKLIMINKLIVINLFPLYKQAIYLHTL